MVKSVKAQRIDTRYLCLPLATSSLYIYHLEGCMRSTCSRLPISKHSPEVVPRGFSLCRFLPPLFILHQAAHQRLALSITDCSTTSQKHLPRARIGALYQLLIQFDAGVAFAHTQIRRSYCLLIILSYTLIRPARDNL